MKICTVLGARPQFIKAATISRCIKTYFSPEIEEVIIHTGQHYDNAMSDVFFEELDIPLPKYNLKISGGSQGEMTGKMLAEIEAVLIKETPDYLLVYGDTNSTLSAALAAAKLNIKIIHIEAGLRSFNMKMPEEVNRIVTDKLSTLLFCPTETAINHLKTEGISDNCFNVGDVMLDAALFYSQKASEKSNLIAKLKLQSHNYILATIHRAENTDNIENLKQIFEALGVIARTTIIILPLHPRTKKILTLNNMLHLLNNITVIEPAPFFDMIELEKNASLIITDSGGVQKEAYFYKVPCITAREETEWVETVQSGWNILTGANAEKLLSAYHYFTHHTIEKKFPQYFGDGNAARNILHKTIHHFEKYTEI